jgi:hypothetical protein
MSQPAQEKYGTPGNEYCVVDNGLAGTGTPPLYYEAASGAIDQGVNAFGNGTIPDFVNKQTFLATIGFKNPA